MNEDFLHYVWKFQKFSKQKLRTTQGETIQVNKVGNHNYDAGPDFLMGQVIIDGQVWVGSIEIHLQSSHWYAHRHENDPNYDNVILHVVWRHDVEIRRRDESTIPTLELQDRVLPKLQTNYVKLVTNKSHWINCEPHFQSYDETVFHAWLDRLFLERLEYKWQWIANRLKEHKNDWEAVLFLLLSRNFGLKVNGVSFYQVAVSIPYKVIQKCRQDPFLLEALLLGQANLLEEKRTDVYYASLQKTYQFLKAKYKLKASTAAAPLFFRLRPPNFPTIRLSQLASLLHEVPHLFSKLIATKERKDLEGLFSISASPYWDTHFNFGLISKYSQKKLSKNFINLLVINTVLPLKFGYAKHMNKEHSEEILQLASSSHGEVNTIVNAYHKLRPIEKNALHSQALIQLQTAYCSKNNCLQCALGNQLLK